MATASPNGTAVQRSSNSSILAAIGANVSAVRQNSIAPGTRRPPSEPPRSTPALPAKGSSNPTPPPPAAPARFNGMQQNWIDANTGVYANLMIANLSRPQPFQLEAVDIRWSNISTGKPEFTSRAVGNVTNEGGKELADLLGGTLMKSPFDTFGTTQKDQYIRMPNGQMVEASVLASQLNAARTATDPFSATQSVIEIYRAENQRFDLNTSTNAVDLVTKRMLNPVLPQITS